MRGSCEVECDASSFQTHQEDSDIWVMSELVNHAVPVVHAHAALQPHALHTSLHTTALMITTFYYYSSMLDLFI